MDRDSHRRDLYLRRKYNKDLAWYNQTLYDQGGGCAICGRRPTNKSLAVDHDHRCCSGKTSCGRCVRGLLCWICNKKIVGMIERWNVNPQKIVEYFWKYRRFR